MNSARVRSSRRCLVDVASGCSRQPAGWRSRQPAGWRSRQPAAGRAEQSDGEPAGAAGQSD